MKIKSKKIFTDLSFPQAEDGRRNVFLVNTEKQINEILTCFGVFFVCLAKLNN